MLNKPTRTISPLLEAHLDSRHLAIARRLGEEAARAGMQAYLVGGPVRDLLLGHAPLDVDFTVEGDAPALARRMAEHMGAAVTGRSQFLTVKLLLGDTTVDLATARRERYAFPGALPQVEPASIGEDLARRDFTINAMAAALAPDRFGELLDPFNSQRDLEEGLLRVLHPDSFRDDATRILRGLRYEQRLGFHLEGTTLGLLRRDRSMLDAISGDRLRHELERTLQEAAPERALERGHALGVLQAIHPSLSWDATLSAAAARLRERGPVSLLVYLALLAHPLSQEQASQLATRLSMPAALEYVVQDVVRLRSSLPALESAHLRPSQVFDVLNGHSPAALEAAAALGGHPIARQWLERFLTTLRHLRPELNGDDLLALGIPPGPRVGEALDALHRARLDGQVTSRQEEVALVQRLKDSGERPSRDS